ncbi:MAG: hypothetical protein HFJ06_00320 [Lachnospiraceae bacterium]|nr:hypothetical protein [Lachnospiraceae bacterium]
MIGSKKQVIAVILCMLLAAGTFACGRGGGWIFSLNGEKIYETDVTAFGLIYIREHNLSDKEQMKKSYDNSKTYGDYYKEELENVIISTALLYNEANEAQFEISDEIKQEAQKNAEEIAAFCGEKWMSDLDISVSDVERVFRMKLLGDAYVDSLSQEDIKAERYIKVYQVTFSTAALDKEGMVQSDEEGKIVRLSDELIAQRKADALDLVDKVHEGGDLEILSKSYGNSVTGMEKYLKYDDLEKEYKRAVDSVSEGEVSGLIEGDYGFYVIELIEPDAKEHAGSIALYEEETEIQEKKEEILEKLYEVHVRDDKDYKNDKRWKHVSMLSFLQ